MVNLDFTKGEIQQGQEAIVLNFKRSALQAFLQCPHRVCFSLVCNIEVYFFQPSSSGVNVEYLVTSSLRSRFSFSVPVVIWMLYPSFE
jgi:hypothetical protein